MFTGRRRSVWRLLRVLQTFGLVSVAAKLDIMMTVNLNTKVNKVVAAVVVAVAAFAIPAFFIQQSGAARYKPTPLSIVVAILYVIATVGLVLECIGKRGVQVTSEATDRKIAKRLSAFQRKLRPLAWVALLLWFVWLAYLVWSLHQAV